MVRKPRLVTVEVSEDVIADSAEDGCRPQHRWTVTTDTGFRAEVTECPCGLSWVLGHNSGTGETYRAPLTECVCKSYDCHRKPVSRSGKCHGWHRKRVDALVSGVAKTSIAEAGA